MHLVDRPNGTFTDQELARLAAYRAAVAAGFYSDWDGSTAATDTELLGWLHAAEGVAYPFTQQERAQLEACRAGVAAGRYTDDVGREGTDKTA